MAERGQWAASIAPECNCAPLVTVPTTAYMQVMGGHCLRCHGGFSAEVGIKGHVCPDGTPLGGTPCLSTCDPHFAQANPFNTPPSLLPKIILPAPTGEKMFLDLTREEAMVLHTMDSVINQVPPLMLVMKQGMSLFGMDYATHYKSFLAKYSHAIHEMGWCPDPNCIDKK